MHLYCAVYVADIVRLEISTPPLQFLDLQHFRKAINKLLQSQVTSDSYEPQKMLPAQSSRLAVPIEYHYNRLMHARLTSLPTSIPARFRLRQEQLCRMIATECYLASIGISIKSHPNEVYQPSALKKTNRSVPWHAHGTAGEKSNTEKPECRYLIEHLHKYTPVQSHIKLSRGIKKVLQYWQIAVASGQKNELDVHMVIQGHNA